MVTQSTGSCLINGQAVFRAKHGLHFAHGHHKNMHRYESFSVFLINLGFKTKRFARGTRVGVAEPYTGEARPFFQGALLAVHQDLAARQELDTQATMAEAEGPPQPPCCFSPQGAGDARGELGGCAQGPPWEGARAPGSVKGHVIGESGRAQGHHTPHPAQARRQARGLGSVQGWTTPSPGDRKECQQYA